MENFNKWNNASATPVINNTPAPLAVLPTATPAKPSLMKRVCTKRNAIIAGVAVITGFGIYKGVKAYKAKKKELLAQAEQAGEQIEAFANALAVGAAATQQQEQNTAPTTQTPAAQAPAQQTQAPATPKPSKKGNKK